MAGMPAGGCFPLLSWMYMIVAVAIWRILLLHCTRFACRRTPESVGSRMLISTAMMPMTTSNSTSVKARCVWRARIVQSSTQHAVDDVATARDAFEMSDDCRHERWLNQLTYSSCLSHWAARRA